MLSASAPVAPLSHHMLLIFLLQVGLLLGLAYALGRAAARFGMPAVVGELLAGVILGPSLLGTLAPGFTAWLLPADPNQFHLLDAAGQIGVILLVGLTGMEMDIGLVRRRGTTAARVSIAGLVVPMGLGIGLGFLLPASLLADGGDRTVFALFLGVVMCVSAIPVIAKILIDMNLLHRNVGQLTLAAATVDDAVGWLMLSVVSAMATTGVRGGDVALSILSIAATVAVAVFVLRPLARVALRRMTRAGENSATFVPIAALIFLAASATHALKLEAIIGAFVAGIVLGSCPEFELERIAPLRKVVLGVLAPIFFATAGLRIDLTALANPPVLAAGAVMLAIAIGGKFAGAYAGARASRLSHWEGIALGSALNARGVIEIVVAGVGLRLGVLSTEVYTIVVLIAIFTSLMTPPVLGAAMARVERDAQHDLRRLDEETAAPGRLAGSPEPDPDSVPGSEHHVSGPPPDTAAAAVVGDDEDRHRPTPG